MKTISTFALVIASLVSACSYEIKEQEKDQNSAQAQENDPVKNLSKDGIELKPFNPASWGVKMVGTESTKSPFPTDNQDDPTSVDPDPNGHDSDHPTDGPTGLYGSISVHKCLKISASGLPGSGKYCADEPLEDSNQCYSPQELLALDSTKDKIDQISLDNLHLADSLIKSGYVFNPTSNTWIFKAGPMTIEITPFKLEAMTLESACGFVPPSTPEPSPNPHNPYIDQSFGEYGEVRLNASARSAVSRKSALQLDGSIIIPSGTMGNHDMQLVRYSKDGKLDQSFGKYGYVTVRINGKNSEAYGVALDESRGRIYATGTGFVAAFKMYGELDQTFANNGIFTVDTAGIGNDPAADDPTYSPVVDSLGQLYVMTWSGSILKLDIHGKILQKIDTRNATSFTFPGEIAVTANRLYVLGSTWTDSSAGYDAIVLTYDLAGHILAKTKIGDTSHTETGEALVVTNSNVFVTGRSYAEGNGAVQKDGYFMAKLRLDGSLDINFGLNGIFVKEAGWQADDIALEASGNLLVVGSFGVTRYDQMGHLVKELAPLGSGISGDEVLVQDTGKIVLINIANGGGEMVRLKP